MNREHLYRGKTDDGVWVYGNYVETASEYVANEIVYAIIEKGTAHRCLGEYGDNYWNAVLPETVGEYTGLTDKNGKKIFEGDIVDDNNGQPSFVCVFDNGHFGFYSIEEYRRNDFSFYDYDFVTSICTIIGNVHDNPEMLKAQ